MRSFVCDTSRKRDVGVTDEQDRIVDVRRRACRSACSLQHFGEQRSYTNTLAYVEAGFSADAADDRHRALYLLKELGLSGREDPASLSGGEARRAALARALT